MAGRTLAASSSNRDDLLLDLDDYDRPAYNGGSRPTMNDEDMLRAYNADHDETQPRPSVSYDDFVGSSPRPPGVSMRDLPGRPGNFDHEIGRAHV